MVAMVDDVDGGDLWTRTGQPQSSAGKSLNEKVYSA